MMERKKKKKDGIRMDGQEKEYGEKRKIHPILLICYN